MDETLNAINHAIKLLQNREPEAAEKLLKEEVLNIHRKHILTLVSSSRGTLGEAKVQELLLEGIKFNESNR